MSARVLSLGFRGLLAVLLVLVAFAACSDDNGTTTTTSVTVTATFGSFVNTGAVDTVTVSASREKPSHQEIDARLTKVNGVWTATIGKLDIGSGTTAWTFKGQAFSSSNPSKILFAGEADNVEIGQFNFGLVMLVLKELAPPPSYANAAPVIDALTISSASPHAGEPVTLTVTAHDADNDTLTYQWGVTGPSAFPSDFGTPSAPTTTWRAPSLGSYAISIAVTDTKGAQDGVNFTITSGDFLPDASVPPPSPTGSADVATSINHWPTFTSFVAAKTLLAPAGDTTTLTVETSDPDGDALTYDWTSDCGGTFGDGTTTRSWTGGAHADGTLCTFTVNVADGRGGTNHGTLGLHVGTLPAVTTP